ncbi:MAG: hypothetical protein R3C03_02835 [Pirellulaceae bacterium]
MMFRTLERDAVHELANRLFHNASIEQLDWQRISLTTLETKVSADFQVQSLPIRNLSNEELEKLSRDGQLSLTLVEMQTIQRFFQSLDRDPTDIELETIAQTWSEHCSHKTLAGKVAYEDENGSASIRQHAQGNDFRSYPVHPKGTIG